MATIGIFKYAEESEIIPAGQTLFNEGDHGNCMFVVQDGELEVIVHGKVVETLGPGSLVGEMALVDEAPRSATVRAKTDCQVVSMDEEKFKAHVHRTPFFAIQVMRVMTYRLRKMNQQV
jgi:CRP-like cAMP-binding protein